MGWDYVSELFTFEDLGYMEVLGNISQVFYIM